MRKSLMPYLLLLPFLVTSAVGIAASMSDAGSISPWSKPVATASEIVDDDNGVNVDNLFTNAPRFDSIASPVVSTLELAHLCPHGAAPRDPPSLVTLNRTFRI